MGRLDFHVLPRIGLSTGVKRGPEFGELYIQLADFKRAFGEENPTLYSFFTGPLI
jgi:hypothetical protein